jgi:hypothetical protein
MCEIDAKKDRSRLRREEQEERAPSVFFHTQRTDRLALGKSDKCHCGQARRFLPAKILVREREPDSHGLTAQSHPVLLWCDGRS